MRAQSVKHTLEQRVVGMEFILTVILILISVAIFIIIIFCLTNASN